jgi:hypothetical protein
MFPHHALNQILVKIQLNMNLLTSHNKRMLGQIYRNFQDSLVSIGFNFFSHNLTLLQIVFVTCRQGFGGICNCNWAMEFSMFFSFFLKKSSVGSL